jgi:Transposase and inactivated derivatives
MRTLAKSLIFTENEIKYLEKVSRSKTDEVRRVNRANILLLAYRGSAIGDIATQYRQTRTAVTNLIKKTLEYGAETALNDLPRSGAPSETDFEDIAWIVYLACEKPLTFGYPNELWTYSSLAQHIRDNAEENNHPSLSKMSKGRIWTILDELEIKPHKMNYYLERKDPDFEEKMQKVLVVYKETELINNRLDAKEIVYEELEKITISYDEKPGIQAISNIASDLAPHPYLYKSCGRDYEYKRLGTVSLLAGLNLHNGEVYALVSDTHKSYDFIEFMKQIDAKVSKNQKIRLLLDNHSVHTSKETMQYLSTMENRFEFSFTPKHGSWLNIVETFFSKMTRSFLRGIRVKSKEELVFRIHEYINIVNKYPVVHKWTYLMDSIKVENK